MMGFPLKAGDVIEIVVADPPIQSTVKVNGIALIGLTTLTFNLDKHHGVYGSEFEFGFATMEKADEDSQHSLQP